MKAYEWQGKEGSKVFYGESISIDNGGIVIIWVAAKMAALINLAPGEWVADYDNTKVPEAKKAV